MNVFALLLIALLPMAGQTVDVPVRPHSVNTIEHGVGAPANSLGTDGDFYIDISAWVIYGPKSNDVWPAGFSLSGTGGGGGTGAQGPVGPVGPQGPTGSTGASGSAGAAATIAVGTTTTGNPGTSATVVNAGSSSAAVFNFSIPQGAPGTQGIQGVQGPQGPPGAVTSSGTSSTSYADAETPGGTINGTNTSFTLANAPTPAASLILVRNGQVLAVGGDYTLSGNAVGFINGVVPVTGDILQAWYRYTGTSVTYNYSDSETPGGATNGSNVTFTLLHTPAGTSLLLTRNGLVQKAGVDYSISGSTVTFTSVAIPGTTDILLAWYRY